MPLPPHTSPHLRAPTVPANPWPLQVFFDGACPICSREMRHYQQRDRLHRIIWVDIAAPGFSASAFGLDPVRVHQMMHTRTSDGHLYTQVAAFVKIWEALPPRFPIRILQSLLKIPGAMCLSGMLYRLFARNRYRLTGRCYHDSCRPRH